MELSVRRTIIILAGLAIFTSIFAVVSVGTYLKAGPIGQLTSPETLRTLQVQLSATQQEATSQSQALHSQLSALHSQVSALHANLTHSHAALLSNITSTAAATTTSIHSRIAQSHSQHAALLQNLTATADTLKSQLAQSHSILQTLTAPAAAVPLHPPTTPPLQTCPEICLDAVIPYHPNNAEMLVHNGGLQSIRKHVKSLRNIYIVSASDDTFKHLLTSGDNGDGPQVLWFDEAKMPFKAADVPRGWLFQQLLKMWAAQSLPGACPNVMIIDADNVFIRDFHPVTNKRHADGTCTPRFKYIVSTKDSGAEHGDINKGVYHDFTYWLTGHPKPRKDFATAIGHWQIMQRDVLDTLTRSLQARYGFQTLHEALLDYAMKHNVLTEYDGYFAFAWYFFQDRMDVQEIPFLTRKPALCKYGDEANMKPFVEKSIIVYFTCHHGFYRDDFYTNCKGREGSCNPGLNQS